MKLITDKQTDRQTDRQTPVKHNHLGGSNNISTAMTRLLLLHAPVRLSKAGMFLSSFVRVYCVCVRVRLFVCSRKKRKATYQQLVELGMSIYYSEPKK